MMAACISVRDRRSGGCNTGTRSVFASVNRPVLRIGLKRNEASENACRPRDNNTLPALRRGSDLGFGEWADFYLENFSRPPFRAPKTREVNGLALKHLRAVFETTKLAELTAHDIEEYLRRRHKQRVVVKTGKGF